MTASTPSLFHLGATSQPNPFQEDGQRRAIHQELEIIRHASMRQLPAAAEARTVRVSTRTLFPCHVEGCGGVLVSQSNLNKHLLKVHGHRVPSLDAKEEVDYPCPFRYCQFGSSNKKDLITHLKTRHTKTKGHQALLTEEEKLLCQLANPYPCPMPGCYLGYFARSKLITHVKDKHDTSLKEAIKTYKASIKVD